jgi:hypothetical protein
VNPNIYLHEIVRTVPGREEPYLASVLSLHHEPVRCRRGRPAFAQFRSVSTSGAWPCGIDIWENTWAGQTEDLVSQFQDAERDVAMEEWWNRNLHLRRGAYDRLLIPAPWSPTLAELGSRGVRGEGFLQEIRWLAFGEPRRYLDTFEERLMPALERLGLDLVGAFRVAMRPRQVVTLLGARGWKGLGSLLDQSVRDPDLRSWQAYRASVVEQAEELLLLPARHGPLVAPHL